MNFKESERHFFILYTNGDTFFFTIDKKGFIYCHEFNNLHQFYTGRKLPIAKCIEIDNNDFKLKSITGETIYSLNRYLKLQGKVIDNKPAIEMFYIDSDIKQEMLQRKKITFSKTINEIPGLISNIELNELESNNSSDKYKIKSYKRTKTGY